MGEAYAIYLAAAGAAISAKQAREQNKAIEKSQDIAYEQATVQQQAIANQQQQRKEQYTRQAAKLTGRATVMDESRGIGLGSPTSQLGILGIDQILARNLSAIKSNFNLSIAQSGLGYDARNVQLGAQAKNPFFSAFEGAIGGAQTGLAIRGWQESRTTETETPFDTAPKVYIASGGPPAQLAPPPDWFSQKGGYLP